MPTTHELPGDDRKVTVDELTARLRAEGRLTALPDDAPDRPTSSHEYFAALALLIIGIAAAIVFFWIVTLVLGWALP